MKDISKSRLVLVWKNKKKKSTKAGKKPKSKLICDFLYFIFFILKTYARQADYVSFDMILLANRGTTNIKGFCLQNISPLRTNPVIFTPL
jgi:hypothetical protein